LSRLRAFAGASLRRRDWGFRPAHCGLVQAGWTPEEISRRIGHISLAQVHAALTYYHANQEAMEAEMAAEEADYDRLHREHQAARAQKKR